MPKKNNGLKLKGTNGDDSLDLLFGSPFNDKIKGLGGDDVIYAGDGDDTVHGGSGSDFIGGGAGEDRLFGGGGGDLFRPYTGGGFINGGGGIDRVSFAPAPFDEAPTLGISISLDVKGRQDTAYGTYKLVNVEYLSGTAFADELEGNKDDNWLLGGGGDDSYFGLGGDDLITVGTGNQTVDGGSGIDTVDLFGNGTISGPVAVSLALQGVVQATGQNTLLMTNVENLSGSDFDDLLIGDEQANTLAGSFGADNLLGGAGDDALYGDGVIGPDGSTFAGGPIGLLEELPEGFDDVLIGGAGADLLVGGGGADIFGFEATSDSRPDQADTIVDFDASEGDVIDLSAIDAVAVTLGDDVFTFIGNDAFSGEAGELRSVIDGDTTYLFGDVTGDGLADFEVVLAGAVPLDASDFVL